MFLSFDQLFSSAVDFALLGMESFIGIWVCAAFIACAYPEYPESSVSVVKYELFIKHEAVDVPTTLTNGTSTPLGALTCKQLQNALREKGVRYYGMNKEAMIAELFSLELTPGK